MDWQDINHAQLDHFRKLGTIRKSNPVIGTGRQKTLDTHTVLRYNDSDSILMRLRPEETGAINLYGVFPDGTRLSELYTGQTAVVSDGKISFPEYKNHIAILKQLP